MTGKAVEQLDNYLNKDQENAVHILPRESPDRTMKAAAWRGKKSIKVEERPVPLLTDPVRARATKRGVQYVFTEVPGAGDLKESAS